MAEGEGIRVGDLMVPAPHVVTPETGAIEAVQLMSEHNIGALVVVEGQRAVGMFTERDVLRHTAEEEPDWTGGRVAEFMTRNPYTVSVRERWDDAMDLMSEHGVRHLPVVSDGRLVGLLSMRDIAHHRTGVLESLVRERTAELKRHNQLLQERERERSFHLRMAAEIQTRMLPGARPDFEPLRFATHYSPCDEVAGDYYDFMRFDEDNLGLLIADVSGHGVPAAFITVMVKTCYAAYCQGLTSPAEILARMNRHLSGLLHGEFVTMFIGRIDRRRHELVYALSLIHI